MKKPCKGDPVPNPEIAPQTNSGIQGGLHDTCARKNDDYTCEGIIGCKRHNGVDIKNPQGAPIFAIYDGIVSNIRDTFNPGEYRDNSYGNYIILKVVINGVNYIYKI